MRIIIVFLLLITSCSPLKKFEGTAAKWEKDIIKLENLDKSKKQNKDAILFIGSSSIRLWRSIKKDLAPYESIKRAYGGARYTDLIHFTERLVSPHDVHQFKFELLNYMKIFYLYLLQCAFPAGKMTTFLCCSNMTM